MSSAHRLLARSVVLILLLGLLPALQSAPAAAQNTGSYTAVKYDCPPGYDPGSGDANAAFNNCTTPAGGVSFTLQSGDASYAGGTQQTNGGGSVAWNGIPLGVGYSVSESVPQGYGTPWVYCEVSGDPNNPGDVQRSYFAANGGNMDVGYTAPSLTSYTQATCYWFNTPPAQNGQAQGYQGGGTAIVKIQKFLCDDSSYDYDSFTVSDYFNNCPDYHNGVKFSVNGGSQTSTGNGNGTVEFGSLAAGQVDIRLHEVSGYQPKAVYCVEFPNGGSASNLTESNKQTWTDEGNGTYRLSPTMVDGYTYYCYWFDSVETHPNVHIYKYYCDPAFDWENGGYDYLLSGCTSAQSGVYFEVHNGSYSQGQSTDSSGHAWWSDVPWGNLGIVEQPPSGYQVGRIFCGVAAQNDSTQPGSWQEYTYSDGWNVDLPEGQYLHCYVFDVPSDYGTIYLYKFYCDPAFDWQNGGYDYLLSGCVAPQSDVYFEVHSGSYSQGQTTDSGGTASWSDVPGGSLEIVEQTPPGYSVGRVFCGYSTDGSTLPSSWQEYTYSSGIQVDLASGEYLFCVYFDIPSDYGKIYFYKYYCDPAFDWENGGYDYLLSGCTTPHENVYFETYSGSYTQGQTTDSSGIATWTDVTWGDLSFWEDVPDGYRVGRVFCGYSETEGTAPTSWDEYSYFDGWDVPAPPGKYLYCYIFDVPTTYGTVYFYKYYCAPDFDWESNGYDYLLSSCTTPHENVYFEAYSGSYTQGQTTDSSGAATWTDVPWGDLSFWEDVPDGYQVGRIFCGYSETEGTPPTSWDEYFYSDGWDVPQPPGKYLYCYIFEVPYDYGTIYLYKYYCEPDFDWQGGGYDYLYAECTSPHENVSFEVHNGGYSQGQTTDSSGAATWSDVPLGDLQIVEDIPDGYLVGRVYCGYSDQEGVPPTSWDEYDYFDGYNVSIHEGEYLYCYIFDVPYDYGAVYIYKYYCEPDFDWYDGGYDYLYSECTSWQPDVNFEIESGGYSSGQTTDSSGTASWADVPAGSLTIYEQPPDGYQVGKVFCGVVAQNSGTLPSSWDEYDYTDGWHVDLPEGQYLHCFVFDVPTEYGWVTIWKYTCPQDFDYGSSDLSYYESSCTERPEGVDFDLYNQTYGYEESQSTDASGEASWSDVPSGGELYFWEVPNGYTPVAVYCGVSSDGSEPSAWDEYFLDSDGALSGIWVEPSQYLYCKWFNKPYDYPQVWIYKYNCDQTAHWNWAYHQLLAQCTTVAPGVEYGWGPQGEDPVSSTMDDQGKWLYEDLEPGTWYWTETYPSGYAGAVVYCQWVGAYGSGDYQKADLDGSTLWLDVGWGDVVTCYWFDFPTGSEPPSSGGSSGSGGSGSSGGSGGSGSSGGSGTSAGSGSAGGGFAGGGAAGGGTGGPPPLTSNAPTGPKAGPPAGGTTSQPGGNATGPATLIIVKRTCPEGFDLYADDGDVEQDCTEPTGGIDFGLTDLATSDTDPIDQTTGDDGKATWTNLEAGPYLIVESMPEDTYAAFIWTCKSDKRQFQLQYPFTPFSYAGPSGEIGITLIAGEKLECAWYDVPSAPVEVTVLKFDCPSSPVIIAQCTPAGAGVNFNLTPAGGAVGAIIQLTTDANGSATGSGVAGPYTLAEQGGTPCLIDSESIDQQGNVVLEAGAPAEIRVYNCGGGGS